MEQLDQRVHELAMDKVTATISNVGLEFLLIKKLIAKPDISEGEQRMVWDGCNNILMLYERLWAAEKAGKGYSYLLDILENHPRRKEIDAHIDPVSYYKRVFEKE